MSFIRLGFDIDGVFVNDIDVSAAPLSSLQDLIENRRYALPQFSINFLCDLGVTTCHFVTARPSLDRTETVDWISKNLKGEEANNPVTIVLHMREDPTVASEVDAATFKANVVKNLKLTHFVESSTFQTAIIQAANPLCKVIVFKDLITDALAKAFYEKTTDVS